MIFLSLVCQPISSNCSILFSHSLIASASCFLSDAYFVKFCSVLPSTVLISSSIAAMSVSISFTRRSLSSTIFSSFLRCFCNCFSAS